MFSQAKHASAGASSGKKFGAGGLQSEACAALSSVQATCTLSRSDGKLVEGLLGSSPWAPLGNCGSAELIDAYAALRFLQFAVAGACRNPRRFIPPGSSFPGHFTGPN